MRVVLISAFLISFVFALKEHKISPLDFIDKRFMDIKILDSKIVEIDKIDGEKFYGISAISYDKNRDILYAISDRGRLFSLRVVTKNGKITNLKPVSGYRFKDKNGKKFFKQKSDSEGMVLVDDGDKKSLLISYELYPKVLIFNTKGREKSIKNIDLNLPEKLKNIRNYQGKNSALEALTYHKKYGILTASEFPLRGQKMGYHGVYNSDGEVCKFKKDFYDNGVTGFESMHDGNILVLQRSISIQNFSFDITLKKVYLEDKKDGVCRSKNLAVFKSLDGWSLDNFEGISHYRDNIYFMISDDNGNMFQKTILTMFKILD